MNSLNSNLFDFLEEKLNLNNKFYLYFLPASRKTETKIWWLTPIADSLSQKLITFEKDYLLTYELNYRSTSPNDVDSQIEQAKTIINNIKCFNLNNYKAIKIDCVSCNSTEDIDVENAFRGSLIINLRVIKENN